MSSGSISERAYDLANIIDVVGIRAGRAGDIKGAENSIGIQKTVFASGVSECAYNLTCVVDAESTGAFRIGSGHINGGKRAIGFQEGMRSGSVSEGAYDLTNDIDVVGIRAGRARDIKGAENSIVIQKTVFAGRVSECANNLACVVDPESTCAFRIRTDHINGSERGASL